MKLEEAGLLSHRKLSCHLLAAAAAEAAGVAGQPGLVAVGTAGQPIRRQQGRPLK